MSIKPVVETSEMHELDTLQMREILSIPASHIATCVIQTCRGVSG